MLLLDALTNWMSKHHYLTKMLIIIAMVAVLQLILSLFSRYFAKTLKQDNKHVYATMVYSAIKPLTLLLWFLTAIVLLRFTLIKLGFEHFREELDLLIRLGCIVIFTWSALRTIKHIQHLSRHHQLKMDRTAIEGLCLILKITINFFAFSLILGTLGVSLTVVYTVMGGAGIGITIALREVLQNVFGGIVLYFGRPFKQGDSVNFIEQDIDGNVMEINWRTTKIKMFDATPAYVPNAFFLTTVVENQTRMQGRQISCELAIRYCDHRVLDSIVTDLQTVLDNSTDINRDFPAWVNLVKITASTLEIKVYAMTFTRNKGEYQHIQQQLLLQAIDIVKAHGAELAWPGLTQSVPAVITLQSQDLSGFAQYP